jgi:hypothetical protein
MTTRLIGPPTSIRVIGPRDVLADDLELAHSDFLDPSQVFKAWGSATARYWLRRAATFEDARPRVDDFHGRATPAKLAARWDRLTEIAQACRNRADIANRYGASNVDRALIVDVATALRATV